MSKLAELLKKRREELKKTPAEVSADTKIRVQFIESIDNGDFKSMPSYLHAYGFVKKYAEYLGFSYDEIKELFESECPKDTTAQTDGSKVELNDVESKKSKKLIILAVIFLVCLGIWLVYSSLSKTDNEISLNTAPVLTEEVPAENTDNNTEVTIVEDNDTALQDQESTPVTEAEPVSVVPEEKPTQTTSAVAPAEAPIKPVENKVVQKPVVAEKYVTLTFSGKCWVEFISDTGKKEDFVAEESTVKKLYFHNGFTISIGNAAAVSLSYRAQNFTNFGSEGEAVKKLHYVVKDGILVADHR